MTQLYHSINTRDTFMYRRDSSIYNILEVKRQICDIPNNESHYRYVATVQSDDLDKVYELTNHIDSDWQEGSRVTVAKGAKTRSTSIGDVLINSTGIWVVAPDGFDCVRSYVVVNQS